MGTMRKLLRWVFVPIVLFALSTGKLFAAEPARPYPEQTADLFSSTTVWNIHLKFAPDEWAAMEPKEPTRGFFGGGGPRDPKEFGPGMFLAPAFFKDGDVNHDQKISAREFDDLVAKWFSEWDKDKAGKLTLGRLRAGITSAFSGGGGATPFLRIRLQGDEGHRNGLASAMGVEFKYVHADFEFEGQQFKDVAVRFKGNGTWLQSRGSDKRSMKVEINHFNKDQKLAGVTTLNLHNDVTDSSWMNEVLSHRLFRDAGIPAARFAYARVYLTVPGKADHKYIGLYSIVENVDKHFVQDNIGGKKGALLKPVSNELFAYMGADWTRYNQTYDPKTNLNKRDKQRIIDFCKLLESADDAEFSSKLANYLDLDEFSRFMAVTVYLSTLDSILVIGQNYYVHIDAAGKFQFLPWDLDHSFGQFPLVGTQEQREQLSINHPWRGNNRFLERVFNVAEFKKLYLDHLADFSKGIFKPERFAKQVDELAAAIRPAIVEESSDKLARFDAIVAGNPIEPIGFGPPPRPTTQPAAPPVKPDATSRPVPPDTRPGPQRWLIKPIKAFVPIRTQSLLDHLSAKSNALAL